MSRAVGVRASGGDDVANGGGNDVDNSAPGVDFKGRTGNPRTDSTGPARAEIPWLKRSRAHSASVASTARPMRRSTTPPGDRSSTILQVMWCLDSSDWASCQTCAVPKEAMDIHPDPAGWKRK